MLLQLFVPSFIQESRITIKTVFFKQFLMHFVRKYLWQRSTGDPGCLNLDLMSNVTVAIELKTFKSKILKILKIFSLITI